MAKRSITQDIGRLTAVAVFASFAAEIQDSQAETTDHWTELDNPKLRVAPWHQDVVEEYQYTVSPPPDSGPGICWWENTCGENDGGNDGGYDGDPPDTVGTGNETPDVTCYCNCFTG